MGVWLVPLLIVVGIAAVYAIAVYNSLISRKVETENAWAQIDVQLKRRYDLIPNLVETVKGYAKHESETLEKVIQARNAAYTAQGPAAVSAAEGQLSGALRQLFAIAEAYPDLKANENFKGLQEELTSTENRVGFARQHYNDVVSQYNTLLLKFPANLVAGMAGFKQVAFFELDASEKAAVRAAPQVKF